MRVLLISGYFPPFAPMAGVRSSKLAKYLLLRGHDVRVLAIKDLPNPPLLPLEIPEQYVRYSRWIDINGMPRKIAGLRQRLAGAARSDNAASGAGDGGASAGVNAAGAFARGRSMLRRLAATYTTLCNWPDPQIGWLPFAIADGTTLLRQWPSDLIYASAPPHTGLLVARGLAHRFGLPWIAEFRDLWVDHPYYQEPPWRRHFEQRHEAAVLRSAAACVTVSDVWAEILRRKFQKPTALILNGFDPDDHPVDVPPSHSHPHELTILYTGGLYPGRRDPLPLFSAVARLGERRNAVRMLFYGPDEEIIRNLAERTGVAAQVEAHAPVPFRQAVELQRTADILLLLRWNHQTERGVVPGKLLEYIGARRPILSLGLEGGSVADIISARHAGLVSHDPGVIARRLVEWIDQKEKLGCIPPLPIETRTGLSRWEQFDKLELFMQDILSAKRQANMHDALRPHGAI